MGIMIDKKRTDAYIGTFHTECADDMLQLSELRKMVSNMNKMLKSSKFDYRFYVKCQGRGSRNVNGRNYNQSLPLEFSTKWDAYIYRRR